ATDKPEHETAGGGAGEAEPAAGMPCAIGPAVLRGRDRADARSRCRAPLHPAPPDRSPRVAWRSSCTTARGVGTGAAARDDAIDPITVANLLRAQIEAELLANHPGEEAAHRVLLPLGRARDGGNRCSFRSAQQREDASLFRARPTLA